MPALPSTVGLNKGTPLARALVWLGCGLLPSVLVGACSLKDLSALSAGGEPPDDGTTEGGPSAEDDAGDDEPRDDADSPGSSDAGDAGKDAARDGDASVSCDDAAVRETEFRDPTIATSPPAEGTTLTWEQTDGVLVGKDGVSAHASVSSGQAITRFLRVTGFPFKSEVPPAAHVVGIEIEVRRSAKGSIFSGNVKDHGVGLFINNELGAVLRKKDGAWSESVVTEIYGGPNDTFEESIEGSILQDIYVLGAGVSAHITAYPTQTQTANIDSVRMKIYYCAPPPP